MVVAVVRHGPRVDMIYGDVVCNPGLAAFPYDLRPNSLSDAEAKAYLSVYADAFAHCKTVTVRTSPWLRCLMTACQLYDLIRAGGAECSVVCDWALTESDSLCQGIVERRVVDDYNGFVLTMRPGFERCGYRVPGRQIDFGDGDMVMVTHGGIVPQIGYLVDGEVDYGYHFYGGFIKDGPIKKKVPGLAFVGTVFARAHSLKTIEAETFEDVFMVDGVSIVPKIKID